MSLRNKEAFLEALKNKNISIGLAKGQARYKMSRGSFKTKDKTKGYLWLELSEIENNLLIFRNGDKKYTVTLEEQEDRVILHFEKNVEYNRFVLSHSTTPLEYIYGCGEQYSHLNLKGKKVDIWVSEHQQVMEIAKKVLREKIFGPKPSLVKLKSDQSYCVMPSYLSSLGYYVSFESSYYGQFEFLNTETVYSFRGIPSSMTIIFERNLLELTGKISKFVGLSPRLPQYAYEKAILASQGGTKDLLERYKKLKDAGASISGLWCQDWCGQIVTEFGSQVYWNWALDEKHYTEFDSMISDLAKEDVNFLGYINTFLKEGAPLYTEAKEKGFLVKKADGSPYLIKSTTFDAGIVDLTNPDGFTWYKEVIKKNMIGRGLKGWMADFGEYLPTDSVVFGGNPEELHNLWPTLWAKCNYEAIKETNMIGKVFYFNRAAYQSTIAYTPSMWSGDQHVDFSDAQGLGSVIPSTLSMACSGVGINHSDIGGYTTVAHMKRSRELLIRWAEMNLFTPVYRLHEGNRPRSNSQAYDEDVYKEFSRLSNIFYKLYAYRKDVLEEYYEKGYPVNRPLFTISNEAEAYTMKREFMFGSDILVAPVVRTNITKHKVFLPKGNWVLISTGEEFEGGHIVIDSPLGMPIAFYKKDSKYSKLFKEITEELKK